MKRIECNEPDDLQQWYIETEPRLTNQKKLFQNLSKALLQITQISDTLSGALGDAIVLFDQFTQSNSEGFISEIVRNANNKLKALKGTLMDVRCSFATSAESLKLTEKTIFPLVGQIKKTITDLGPKKNIDACALCSIQAYEFMETSLIDMYAISVTISIDLNRLTSTEKYTVGELRSMKELTIPRLRYDLKNTIKQACIPISNQSLAALIEQESLTEFELPLQIHRMFYFLYEVGYATTGIFRLAGRADTVALYAKYPSLIEYDEKNTIVIAATLKKFMRDLPEPIIPPYAYQEIIAATRDYDQQSIDNVQNLTRVYMEMDENPHINLMREESTPLLVYLSKMKSILSKYPIASTVIRYFVELAVKISKGPSLMTPNNLAICLAPCVLSDSKADLTESGYCVMFFESLIENFEYVFNTKTIIYTLARKNEFHVMKKRATLISGKEKKEFIGQHESVKSLSPPVELEIETNNPQSPISYSPSKPINPPVPVHSKSRSSPSTDTNCTPPTLPPRPQQLIEKCSTQGSVMGHPHQKKTQKKKVISVLSTSDGTTDSNDGEVKRKVLPKTKSVISKTMKESEVKLAMSQSCPNGEWNSLIEEMAVKRKQMMEKRQPGICLLLFNIEYECCY